MEQKRIVSREERNPDILIDVKLSTSLHGAHWNFNFDRGRYKITLNLPATWDIAAARLEDWRGYVITDQTYDAYTAYLEVFMDELTEGFLSELICIERKRQGIRLKYPHCTPCCVARVLAYMMNYCHDSFLLPYPKIPRSHKEE